MKGLIENNGNVDLSKKTFSNSIVKNNIRISRKKYITPRIEWIPLDNDISLALESNPPAGPSETLNCIRSPFKQQSGLV